MIWVKTFCINIPQFPSFSTTFSVENRKMARKSAKSSTVTMVTTADVTATTSEAVQRFTTDEAMQFYNQFSMKAIDTPIRGFEEDWDNTSKYFALISKTQDLFQWHEYAKHPKDANISIVHEWFANLHIPATDESREFVPSIVIIRGVKINFFVEKIREFYALPIVAECNYKRLIADKTHLKLIYPTLCPFGSKSIRSVIDK